MLTNYCKNFLQHRTYLKTSRYMLTLVSVTLISIFDKMNEICSTLSKGRWWAIHRIMIRFHLEGGGGYLSYP